MSYKKLNVILFLLISQSLFINIRILCSSNNQAIIFIFRTLDDEIPINGFLILKAYNNSFFKNYEIVDGEVKLHPNYNNLNASIIWVPFNRTIMELGKIANINPSGFIILKLNVINTKLKCDTPGVNISRIKLYLNIYDENQSKIWEMYEGSINLTMPVSAQFNYNVIYPFLGENFTICSGEISAKKEQILKLDVIDIKSICIRLSKAISNIVIKLDYGGNSLFIGKTNESGILKAPSYIITTSIKNLYWLALYEDKEVGKSPFIKEDMEVVLNITDIYFVCLNFIDLDGGKIGYNELEIYINKTRLEKPFFTLLGGNYILTVKRRADPYCLNVGTNMTNLPVNKDINMTVECNLRRFNARIHQLQVEWLIGVFNNQPVLLQYSDDMLIPFGTFSMYSNNSLIGYLNNNEIGLKVVKLSEKVEIVSYEPSLILNIPVLIILQLLSLVLSNIILIKWYKSRRKSVN